jgi:TetR/AcrR family transcriptional regulator, transcriptional repressor for nem operon
MRRIHNKEDIVQAGLDIILSKGFNGTGIDAILKQANVPKGSFYNFFSSKDEFGLAAIDLFLSKMAALREPIVEDVTLSPLTRIRKCFEAIIEHFIGNNCTKGCLIGNLSLELSDQYEVFRTRLDEAFNKWTNTVAVMLEEAQAQGELTLNVEPAVLAENLVVSFEGALMRAKVKKSAEPLRNFIHLYFEVFLA